MFIRMIYYRHRENRWALKAEGTLCTLKSIYEVVAKQNLLPRKIYSSNRLYGMGNTYRKITKYLIQLQQSISLL